MPDNSPIDKTSEPSRRWTVESALAFIRTQVEAHNFDREPNIHPLRFMPPIGANHRLELVVEILAHLGWEVPPDVADSLWYWGEGGLDGPINDWKRQHLPNVEELRLWNQRCQPPWPEYDLRRLGRLLKKHDKHEQEADDLDLCAEDANELLAKDGQPDAPDWLVQGVLVAKEPATIGGPIKSLKTSIAMDLAISLGTGTPFLGHFPVPKPRPVLFYSGESGRHTLARTARAIAQARGINLADADLRVVHKAPLLTDPKQLRIVTEEIRFRGAEVVLFDPYYKTLGPELAANASNMFIIGPALERITAACQRAGALPGFAAHTVKFPKLGRPLALYDLAFSGLPEHARQWLLVNRRSAYQYDGKHQLVVSYGGSAGHSGLIHVDVDEQFQEPGGPGTGWQVHVSQPPPPSAPGNGTPGQRWQTAYNQLPKQEGGWVRYNQVKERAGLNADDAKAALRELGDAVEIDREGFFTNSAGKRQKARMVRQRPTSGKAKIDRPTDT